MNVQAAISQEQIEAVIAVISMIAVSNFAQIAGWVWGFFRGIRKTRKDVNALYARVRAIEKHLKISNEEENHG